MTSKIGKQILQATKDRRVDQREVQTLIATATANGVVSKAEKRELKALLEKNTSQFTAGAKATLAAFLDPAAPVPPTPPGSSGSPLQVELPASSNPYYPNDCPWYGVPTGRMGADGKPAYAFFSRGMAINNRPSVTEGGKTYTLDKGIFALGTPPTTRDIPVIEPSASRASVPAWARNGDVSIVHAPENKEFLAALMQQLGPELARYVRAEAPWHRGLEGVTEHDIKNVAVTYVAQYGQAEGSSGNGRRIAISFEVNTPRGVKKLTSDLSDAFYTDPVHGGQYGFRGSKGQFIGLQPIDNVMVRS